MAAVKNAVARVLADGPFARPDEALRAIRRTRAWLDLAAKATIDEVAAMIPTSARILTCSYSGTIREACLSAFHLGKRLEVIALRSQTRDIAYGERLARSLVAHGIAAQVCPDAVNVSDLGPLTMALIGADRVGPDGSLVNGVPSLWLAEQVHNVAPLYVAAETFKLDDAVPIEDGFDLVPPHLITGYITNQGRVEPSRIWRLRGSSRSSSPGPQDSPGAD